MDRVDIAIIGAGPAGISAAINARIRNRSFLLFGSDTASHKVEVSACIDNYIGCPHVTGAALNERFRAHLRQMDIAVTKETITGIYAMGDFFMLLAGQKEFAASTVILATGTETVKPVPGEREFLGKGVSYCATCDGGLYRGKTIAAFCDIPAMEEEIAYLAGLADHVWYDPRFDSTLQRENIFRLSAHIRAVTGSERVNGVRLQNGETVPVDGVFFLKQAVAADILLHGLAMENGHILVDTHMATNIPGCFAAGDCVGTPYQIAKAAGEGNIALHSAISYLGKKE